MSWYVVTKDEPGHIKKLGEEADRATTSKQHADQLVKTYGGHVIELVEAPEKVVVSEAEAEMLKKAKYNPTLRPSFMITEYSDSHKGNILGNDLEDRLMRAYVIGWTVEKHKRYVLPMEGTKLADGTIAYATLDHTGVWTIKAYSKKQSAVTFHATVTQSDIDTAPKWVQVLERVEATDDEV